jgi:hypothetical protein
MEHVMQPCPAYADSIPDHILFVGRDTDGRWVVQENHGLIEGLFVNRAAALHFAQCERHAFPAARIEFAATPLHSILSR